MPFAIEYRCAGPLLASEELQRLVIEGGADPDAARAELRQAFGVAVAGRRDDEEEWVYRLRVARARKPCGVDLTHLVAELPEDGDEHAITCPVCGNVARIVRYP